MKTHKSLGNPNPATPPRFTDLLPYADWNATNRLFVLDEENKRDPSKRQVEALGFVLELNPGRPMTDRDADLFANLCGGLPSGAAIQVSLLKDHCIGAYLNAYATPRNGDLAVHPVTENARKIANVRCEEFAQNSHGKRQRVRVIISVLVPARSVDSATDIETLNCVRTGLQSMFGWGHNSAEWGPSDLVAWNAAILDSSTLTEVSPRILEFDTSQPIKRQMFPQSNSLVVEEQFLTIKRTGGTSRMVTPLSVQDYPQRCTAMDFCGLINKILSISRDSASTAPCLITLGVVILDRNDVRRKIDQQVSRSQLRAASPFDKIDQHETRLRAESLEVMRDSLDSGVAPVGLFHQILVFSEPECADIDNQAMVRAWAENGFSIAPNTFLALPGLLRSLPLTLLPSAQNTIKNIRGYSTMTAINAASMLPLSFDATGCGAPIMPLWSRHGIPMSLDPFASSGNHNLVAIGRRDHGRKRFIEEITLGYMKDGDLICIFDPVGEYRDLCSSLGGVYIDSIEKLCSNPFALTDTDRDPPLDLILALVSEIQPPMSVHDGYVLQNAMTLVHRVYGESATFDILAESMSRTLSGAPDAVRLQSLGAALAPLTSTGRYGKLFASSSRDSLQWKTTRLMVIGDRALFADPIQSALLMLLATARLAREMYSLRDDGRKVVVFDGISQHGQTERSLYFREFFYRIARREYGSVVTCLDGSDDMQGCAVAINNSDTQVIFERPTADLETYLVEAVFNHRAEILSALSSITHRHGSFDEFLITNGWGDVAMGRMLHDPVFDKQFPPAQLLQ